MEPRQHPLKNGAVLLIREATAEDARALLDYLACIGAESDFPTFGPGETKKTEAEERDYLRRCNETDNQLSILGLINDRITSTLDFSAGQRPRLRHSGELGMSVRKDYWSLGIGSLMLDALIDWAKQTGIFKKINLRVRTDNNRAIALYKRKGFLNEGTIRREMFVNGTYFDHYWMGLEL